MDYRETSTHSTTGVSPSELLHGRLMGTKLQVIDMPVPPSDSERVKDKQQKMKKYTDAKRPTIPPTSILVTKYGLGSHGESRKEN